ncbi:MAG: hypothetical protein NTU61_05125, partial [Candidatus Altiarchaeota archaeon]|nr:hypothetical protein [Candidatus Altiarchaeota archaeon]
MDPLQQLNLLNKQFCKDALFVRPQFMKKPKTVDDKGRVESFYGKDVDEVPDISNEIAVHRVLQDKGGLSMLFPVDLDYYGRNPVEKTLDAAFRIEQTFPGRFFVKYSGNRGMHLICRINREGEEWRKHAEERQKFVDPAVGELNKEIAKTTGSMAAERKARERLEERRNQLLLQSLKDYFRHVAYRICKHVPGITISQDEAKKKDLIWVDLDIKEGKLIRGLCVNYNTEDMMYSVPVDVKRDSVKDILERAELKAPANITKIEIPEFKFYDLADPKDDVGDAKVKVDIERIKSGTRGKRQTGKLLKEDFTPCIKKVLAMRAPGEKPNQNQLFLLVTYMNQQGYPKQDILDDIRQIMGPEYNPGIAETKVGFIISKDYRYPSCAKIKVE